MEAGMTKVIIAAYTVMKMTRVSSAMQTGITIKVIRPTAKYLVLKMARASMQWKRE